MNRENFMKKEKSDLEIKDKMRNIIEKNRIKIYKSRTIFERSIRDVKSHLIEPVLNKIGWTTSDPDFVSQKTSTSGIEIPDYTFNINGKDVMIVKVITLRQTISDELSQLVRYCTNHGIEYGILSDGNLWWLFKVFDNGIEKESSYRIIWYIDVEEDKIKEIEMRLKTFSYHNFIDIKEQIKNILLNEVLETVLNTPHKTRDSIIGRGKFELDMLGYNIELNEIDDFIKRKIEEMINGTTKEYNKPIIHRVE